MVHRTVIATLVLSLAGCATSVPSEDQSYFMVSRGKASWVYQLLGTGIDYCKLTQKNMSAATFTVVVAYDGRSCTVQAEASDAP